MICSVMSPAGVGPLGFIKFKLCIYQEMFISCLSADKLYEDNFIFQQDMAPSHTAQSPTGLIAVVSLGFLHPKPLEKVRVVAMRKMGNTRVNNADNA